MTTKISRFLHETSGCDTPALYFEQPEQLFMVFRDLEEHNLGSLLQCEKLMPSVGTMATALEHAANEFAEELCISTEDVADLTALVLAEEAKAEELEVAAKKLSAGNLHHLLTEKKAVNITACVEDAYERVVGPNDSGLGALEMMKAIEKKNEELLLELDILPTEIVGKAKKSWEKEDRRVKQEAKVASNKVHQMNMLTKKLSGALKPWSAHPRRRLMRRSEPPKEKVEREPPPPPLTVEQLEQRHFYEDTEGADKYRPLC